MSLPMQLPSSFFSLLDLVSITCSESCLGWLSAVVSVSSTVPAAQVENSSMRGCSCLSIRCLCSLKIHLNFELSQFGTLRQWNFNSPQKNGLLLLLLLFEGESLTLIDSSSRVDIHLYIEVVNSWNLWKIWKNVQWKMLMFLLRWQ